MNSGKPINVESVRERRPSVRKSSNIPLGQRPIGPAITPECSSSRNTGRTFPPDHFQSRATLQKPLYSNSENSRHTPYNTGERHRAVTSRADVMARRLVGMAAPRWGGGEYTLPLAAIGPPLARWLPNMEHRLHS